MIRFASFAGVLLASGYYLYSRGLTLDDVVLRKSYDYIIVGAGTAGSLMAARLSENQNKTVLLLEAGGEDTEHPMVKIPIGLVHLMRTEIDWLYHSVPQKHSHIDIKDQRSYWPRGKVIGGTGAINVMVYSRGLAQNYNKWSSKGCKGWSYDEVLPYFMKSEKNQNEEYKRSGAHGTDGLMNVVDCDTTGTNNEIFLEAARAAGYETRDINNGKELGKGAFMRLQGTIENGQRVSTASAFLKEARLRTNLHVSTHSHVTKVAIEGRKAVGVDVIKNGRKHRMTASKEVILSAGTIGSPQLLMLSGIGPKEHLDELKIPVISDLPVGESLQDHLMLHTRVSVNASITVTIPMVESYATTLRYLLFGTGPLASNAFTEINGYARSKLKDSSLVARYVQYHVTNTIFDKRMNIYDFTQETWERINIKETEHNFILATILSDPLSRGNIRLRTTDPFDYPLIDPNYLDNSEDVELFRQGIRMGLDILGTEPYQKFAATPIDDTPPSCKHHSYQTDSYWECVIRHYSVTMYHPTSTCKMGAMEDPTAVVDPQLRVKGIQGLRVVDASVMPTITTGNINAPVVMIAEKAADMIRGT